MNRTALELRRVSFAYDGNPVPVLDNADLAVNYGEVTLLSGYSGSGKSTVLSLFCGIIPNVAQGTLSGVVKVDGKDIAGLPMSVLSRKVGVVLQNAENQIIQDKVEDEIAFGCENLAKSPEDTAAAIDNACRALKLDKTWSTKTLSGGQKQRLITAATLAMGQKIMILDEPLANLDKAGTRLLMGALRSLAKSGYAVLVVEHRLDMVLDYVDRVFAIDGGKINEISDTDSYLRAQAASISDDHEAGATSGDVVFALREVGCRLSRRDILKSVSFDIRRGERVLLLGENGCGKTTLMRLIARLIRPSSGRIDQYLGKGFGSGRAGRKWFGKVGVVYQNPNYQLFMPTVRKEIAFGAKDPATAEKIAEKFELTDIMDRHPQSLSEGQKRRVSVAAVLATQPEVLILDEPTVGQDYRNLKKLISNINAWHRESGGTLICVTHDLRCAAALCDKAVLIKDGVAAETGGKELAERYFGIGENPERE